MDLFTDATWEAGLFVEDKFLDVALCRCVRAEVDQAEWVSSMVTSLDAKLNNEALRTDLRRSRKALVSLDTQEAVAQRLEALRPRLANHFQSPLGDREELQFLLYEPGDFFGPHIDAATNLALPNRIRNRRVSIVIFLNGHTAWPELGAYCGGALTFLETPRPSGEARTRTLVYGREGMLVAFPSDLRHEVRPVTHGCRYTVVSWFGAARPADDG